MIDVYRGRIAIQQNGRWYWAHLSSGLVAVAHPNRPNQHHAICRVGQWGHVLPNPFRFLFIGAMLSDDEHGQIKQTKFGFVETINPLEDA
jgi:hypothetical protein